MVENPYQSSLASTPVSQTMTPGLVASTREAPKIEGWLILPALGLVLGPIVYFVEVARQVGSGYLGEIGEINAQFPGFLAAFAITTLCDILLVGFQIYVAVRFFNKHVAVPRLIVIRMLANLGAAILYWVWFTSVFQQLDIDGFRMTFSAVIGCSIWIPYFMFSKRVKATFIVDPTIERTDVSAGP